MNILFITLVKIENINERGIYPDLLRYFIKEGHKIYIASPVERRYNTKTHLIENKDHNILNIRTLNIQKASLLEKGIGTFLLEFQFEKAIRYYFHDIKFDLILYSTPPITITRIIKFLKHKHHAKSYLLLKDIFPQNAVDIGLISNSSIIYKYFRYKEKELYQLSDYIGCMSQKNIDYFLKHNPEIEKTSVELCPNSIELKLNQTSPNITNIKEKYKIPINSTVFIYGGNLGKPQGLGFLLKILDSNKSKNDRFFLIVGYGTEYNKIADWFKFNNPKNAKLIKILPKCEYDELVRSCDVGLIFLDPRFTIPNYPSRLLTYLENKMPVLIATDINTDIGEIAKRNGYGYWCENGDLEKFNFLTDQLCESSEIRVRMGENGYNFLNENYTVAKTYKTIMDHFK